MVPDKKDNLIKNTPKRGIALEEAYRQIKRMLYLNELVPGQKLVYNDLAKRLNISVTPVIQALNRLESSRLVRYVPNRGYFVDAITEMEARNLYQAREALEVFSIPAIMENLNSRDLDTINETFKKYREAIHDENRRELVLLDCKFHMKISEFGHNDVICRLLGEILEQMALKYRAEYLGEDRVNAVVKEHRELLDAFRKADMGDAIRITRQHIKRGMEHVVHSIIRKSELQIDQIFLTTA
ncbi:MAG: GntR family transcriptional regulator [Deltaproteobacteria bacterium]|nr:GntR family transcriptional regulator [Deltaproteobacteria bacterium]